MEMVCDDVLRRDFVGGLVTYFIYTKIGGGSIPTHEV